MNFSNYYKTPLEQWIESQYRLKGLLTPADLDIERIGQLFGVEVVYYDRPSFSDNELNVIFLNRSNNLAIQRRRFFHELCHVLRHAGDQRRMPTLFKQLQENDAEMFSLYAAIPFFMIQNIELPWYESEAIDLIAKEFQLPEKFARRRFNQIKERIDGAEFIAAAFTYKNISIESGAQETSVENEATSNEPSIHAVYNGEDFSRPFTLVIEHQQGFDWDKPLHVKIDRHYESCEPRFFTGERGAQVVSEDIIIPSGNPGQITINMPRIAWRQGQTSKRLFLPMEALEEAINF